jgi:AraC family transcriptional activator of pyochelin receptor
MELIELPAFLRQKVQRTPTIPEVARLCFKSPSAFKQHFKNAYGEPYAKYCHRIKMYVAADMLTSGNYTYIHEVGRAVGWTNLAHFAAAYKKFYGHCPHDCFIKKM